MGPMYPPSPRETVQTPENFMKIERECQLTPINWALLPELEAKLSRLDYVASESLHSRVTIKRFPNTLTFDSTEAAYQNIREAGVPDDDFAVWLYRKQNESAVSVYFGRSGYGGINVTVQGTNATAALIDTVVEFLGLQPAALDHGIPASVPMPRTAFIAHRFDELGGSLADKVARFLELVGFSVISGRAYAPKSVAEKVRQRLSQQAITIAILTSGTDDTWLTQESILAGNVGKPLILLKATDAEFKPGLLSDHEYVPFESPYIESTFIAVLEGLREVGYAFRSL